MPYYAFLCSYAFTVTTRRDTEVWLINALLQLHRIPQPNVFIVLVDPGIAGFVAEVFQVHHKIPANQ